MTIDEYREKIALVARYGGEEFIVVLQDKNLEQNKSISESISNTIEQLKIKHEFLKFRTT